jgi:hypothetical protein
MEDMEEVRTDREKIIVCHRYLRCEHANTWRCDYCVKNLNRTQTADYFEPAQIHMLGADWDDFGEK